jgi:Tol biopolymer transport system component
MKIKLIITVSLIAILSALLSFAGSAWQVEDPGVLLRAAIEKEEVEGDLLGAIDLYKQIIAKYRDSRAIAAEAQLRIGMCYEKLGFEEAPRAYQRVINDFPEQTEMVKAAKEKLSILNNAKMLVKKGIADHRISKIYESTEKAFGFISPDGNKLALVGEEGDIWLREVSSGKETRLTQTPGFKYWCFWSPDSKTIAYLDASNGLYIVPAKGGEPRALIKSDSDFRKEGNSAWPTGWTSDSQMILCQVSKRGLCAIPVSGGEWEDIFNYPDQKTEKDFGALTLSPNGKFLAYGFNNDIYIMPIDGSKPIKVTDHSFLDFGPIWSFDGKWISFISTRSGKNEIWVRRISEKGHPEGEPVQVSRGFASRISNWAKDGKIGISLNTSASNIFVIDLETGKETQLRKILASERHPRWSPDGRQIAFISVREKRELLTIPAGGGEARKVLMNVPNPNQNRYITRPSWLPDGKKLIFGGFFGYDSQGIWMVPAEGGVPQKMEFDFDTRVECCDISPDGAYIAFDYIGAKEGNPIMGSRPFEKDIYVIPFKGGAPMRITRIEKSGLSFGFPRWSPDGKRIAFHSIDWFAGHEGKESDEIWVCEFPDGEPRSITKKMKGIVGHLSWLPDGKTIIFSKIERNKDQIYAIPANGGDIKKLNIEGFSPDFSSDGKKIVYGKRLQKKVEYWLVENFLPLGEQE